MCTSVCRRIACTCAHCTLIDNIRSSTTRHQSHLGRCVACGISTSKGRVSKVEEAGVRPHAGSKWYRHWRLQSCAHRLSTSVGSKWSNRGRFYSAAAWRLRKLWRDIAAPGELETYGDLGAHQRRRCVGVAHCEADHQQDSSGKSERHLHIRSNLITSASCHFGLSCGGLEQELLCPTYPGHD